MEIWCTFVAEMKKRYDSPARQIRPKHWLLVAANCCVVVLFAFSILVSAQVGRMANSQDQVGTPLHHDGLYLPASHSHHSSETFLSPMVWEVSDGSESENDCDDQIGKLGNDHAADLPINLHNGKLLFQQLRLASEGLTRVSLIILHHSWKSFLS